jgi:hypothetical protein
VSWLFPAWVEAGGGARPWEREAAEGEPEIGDVSERPENIVNVDALEPDAEGDRVLAGTAGALQSRLHHRTLASGRAAVPAPLPFRRGGDLRHVGGHRDAGVDPEPGTSTRGVEKERHELRAGHVVARPPGTKNSHFFRRGDEGATMLVYGTQEPNDIAYYPHSNKFYIRGIGLIGRLESLEYADGETEFGG